MRTIEAYTDGSAVVSGPRKGNGGFGTYFPSLFGTQAAFSYGFKETKTGRMEISALYYAITALYENHIEPIRLVVYSDSQYVVKTFTEGRLNKWVREDFQGIKNVDMWKKVLEALDERKSFLKLTMRHIKAHQTDATSSKEVINELKENPHIMGNLIADKLADYKRHKILLESDKLI